MNNEKVKRINRTIKALVRDDTHLSINELRVVISLERAIARLESQKELAKHLVFKGGLVLFKIFESIRFTRDVDALAVSIDKGRLKHLIVKALEVDLDDGLWFGDFHVVELNEQGQYGSYRLDCAFQIGTPDLKKVHKLSRVHIDIGFSDKLSSLPPVSILPSILKDEKPISWRIYPAEHIFAEKLETLYNRGSANSRAKDIYDLVHLISLCPNKQKLAKAIKKTFENRNTQLPTSFAKSAKNFDKTFLKSAWPGVRVLGYKVKFEEAWEDLMQFLIEIDVFFSQEK